MNFDIQKLFSLSGRTAVVTGGNGGIGLAIAAGLSAAGARVAIAGRNMQKSRMAAKRLGKGSVAIEVDVAEPASCYSMVREVVDRCERLDILVNCAGINVRKQPHEVTFDEWNAVLAVNLGGTFTCAQAVYPEMQRIGGGKIINISSIAALFGPPFVAPYGASKAAVLQLTRTLANAWAKDGIQVNAILPGFIDTDMTREARQHVPGISERALARTPAKRWGVPDDLAGVAVFLAAPASDFVTGASITVDGGFSTEG